MKWEKVKNFLEGAAPSFSPGESPDAAVEGLLQKKHAFPGAVLLVGQSGEIVFHEAVGCRSLLPHAAPMAKDTVFDIASLTKVIVTTTLVMRLFESGLLDIESRLSRILQTFATHGKEQMTVRHLLSHTSGYPATVPFYKELSRIDRGERQGIMFSRGAVEFVYNEIFRLKLDNVPGKVAKYSDLGFILLQNVLEVLTAGKPLDKQAQDHIFAPLKLASTGFIDLSKVKRRGLEPVHEMIAPTARCPWRDKIIHGEVHDDNAWAMGGIAGHAGLFSTAEDVHRFAHEMIESYKGRGSLVGKDALQKFWTVDGTVKESSWALGWDTPSKDNSSSGTYFSPRAVGHLGFTGCSLWIDPEREVDVVLLSNRIHPSPDNNSIKDFRPAIHNLIMEALGFA